MDVPIGHHIYLSKDYKDYLCLAKKSNATFVQFFLRSPQNSKEPRKDPVRLMKMKKEADKNNIKIVIHASYLLNFCNNPKGYIHQNAINLLKDDLEDSLRLGAIGVIVHMGKMNTKEKKLDEKEALNNFVKGIKKVLMITPKDSTIIFETGAGCGSEICTSFYGLSRLYDSFTKKEKERIKFCIDTCHIFASGHDLRNEKYMNKVFYKMVDITIGWDKVVCIHLNDSITPFGSMKDRHGDLGRGYIGDKALKTFVKKCYEKKIPMVMETPRFYYDKKGNYYKDNKEGTKRYEWDEQMDKIREWLK